MSFECTCAKSSCSNGWGQPNVSKASDNKVSNCSPHVVIDSNLYDIIVSWIRNGKRFTSKDDLIVALLDEYEDEHLRVSQCSTTSFNQQSNNIFKPRISCCRPYTSRDVYAELQFIFETNRYHIKSLILPACPEQCVIHPPCVGPCCNQTVEDYIKQLIKTNYEQALLGLNKSSILMSLPPYINRQEFENKIKIICDCDVTSYKLKQDLEVI